ncbi:MAG: hypothetical protein AB8B39_05975, partial [Prochlorococcus sp.]
MAILSYSISYSNSLLIALLIYSYFVLLLEGISIATWSFGGFYVIYGFVLSRDFVLLRCSLELSLNSRPHYENNASKVLVWLESS